MIISIIQPCFVPWLGYIEQMALADIFVYLDDVQYNRRNWRNNNQLKSPSGLKEISVSVKKAPFGTLIKDIEIAHHLPWADKLRNQLLNWYAKAPYFEEISALIEPHLAAEYPDLVTFNQNLNQSLLDYLNIKTAIYRSSDISSNKTDKIARIGEICRHFDNVTTLFDGKSAQNFLNRDSLKEYGVLTVFQDYEHQPYPQLWGDFLPYMSVLDCLFNCGPQALDYIITDKSVQHLSQLQPTI